MDLLVELSVSAFLSMSILGLAGLAVLAFSKSDDE
jgi:hypothetical protein